MPKGRNSPGVGRGHNSGEIPHEDIRAALATEIIHKENIAKATEARKRARKAMEGKGIPLERLDALFKRKDHTAGEIELELRQTFHFYSAINPALMEQFDLFSPKASAPERRAAYYTTGLMAGIQGKELVIPPAVTGDDREQLIAGHAQGASDRKAASDAILESAVDPKNKGKTTDGTAKAVGEKAAADFVADNGVDPLVVDGKKHSTLRAAEAAREVAKKKAEEAAKAPPAEGPAEEPDAPDEPEAQAQDEPDQPEEQATADAPIFDASGLDDDLDNWFAGEKKEFRAWFATLPHGAEVDFENPAAAQFFAELSQARPSPAEVEESFEPEHHAGPAPAGITYRLSSDEPDDKDRVSTYKDGSPLLSVNAGNSEFPIYDEHPIAKPVKPKSQSQIAAEKREAAGVK